MLRQEIPHCINHPLYNMSALTVGTYKLLLGLQFFAFWQGPNYPNGTEGEPYLGSNNTQDCGDIHTMEGGCLYNIREV